ncbi:MAG: hypothetical protein QM796_10350 [Chthoniobacteraceae bacterium]
MNPHLSLWRALFLFLAALLPHLTHGHTMPTSAVMLDFERSDVAAELVLPLQELEIAFKHPLLDTPDQVVPEYGPELKTYLLAHIHPIAPDGRAWTVEVQDLSGKNERGAARSHRPSPPHPAARCAAA